MMDQAPSAAMCAAIWLTRSGCWAQVEAGVDEAIKKMLPAEKQAAAKKQWGDFKSR